MNILAHRIAGAPAAWRIVGSNATPAYAGRGARLRAACSIALMLACASAPAGELWRCGPDGRVFTDRPCADGAPVARAAPPSAEARAEAQAVAAREQLALQHLVAERRAREAAPWAEGRFAPAAIRPVADAHPNATGSREKPGPGPRKRANAHRRASTDQRAQPEPAAPQDARAAAAPPAVRRPYAARAPS